jgi:hypothetical protein
MHTPQINRTIEINAVISRKYACVTVLNASMAKAREHKRIVSREKHVAMSTAGREWR